MRVSRCSSLWGVVGLLVLVGWSPPSVAHAAPSNTIAPRPIAGTPCGEQSIAFDAVRRAVDDHNRKRRVFNLPAEAGPAAAYDREIRDISARQGVVQRALDDCVAFLNNLELPNTVERPPEALMTRLASAQSLIPKDFRYPDSPPRRSDGLLRAPPELTALHEALVAALPDGTNPAQFPHGDRPAAGAVDPAFAGASEVIPANADGSSAVFPMVKATPTQLLYVPGFISLPPQYMYFILTAPANMTWSTAQGSMVRASDTVSRLTGGSRDWVQQKTADGEYFARAVSTALPTLTKSIDAVR